MPTPDLAYLTPALRSLAAAVVAGMASVCGAVFMVGCDGGGAEPPVPFDEGAPVEATAAPLAFDEGVDVSFRSPRVSPDSRHLAYYDHSQLTRRLVVLDLGGGGATAFDAARGGSGIDWSPDGEWIVYVDGRTVRTARPDGSDPAAVGTGGTPAWSPDGGRIAYVQSPCARAPAPPDCGVMVVPVRAGPGGTLAPIGPAVNAVPYGSFPTWHPDGARLFYSAPLPNPEQEAVGVAVVGADGAATSTALLPLRHRFVRRLGASADGTRLVFEAEDGTWVAAADGSGERRVLPWSVPGGNGSPGEATFTGGASWAPDGRLAYDLFRAARASPSPIAGGTSVRGVITVHLLDLDSPRGGLPAR